MLRRKSENSRAVPVVERPTRIDPPDSGGERGRNRTYNLVIKSHLLCQLSYAPGWDCDLDLADAGRLANSPNIARPARK